MQTIVPIALFIVLSSASHSGHAAPGACERLEQQRDRVYEQLRSLHSAARGNALRARLREINSKIAHTCR